MDTRNRWQRIHDARYRNADFTKAEIAHIRATRLGEWELDKLNRLSDQHGHTLIHPRTHERIRMKTSDVVPTRLQPRLRRTLVPTVQRINVQKTPEGKLDSVWIDSGKNKRKSWKSVWYSGNNRRK